MPKVKIEFTLPEEQDEYNLANNAGKYMSICYEFTNLVRSKTKHGDGKPVSWEVVREEWWQILNDEGIDPYEA